MDIFAGLQAPIMLKDLEDKPTQEQFNEIIKCVDDILLKAKKFGGVSSTQVMVTDVRTNAGQLQKKSRTVTLVNGIITSLGTETDWVNAGAV
jgi:hypothetical protein